MRGQAHGPSVEAWPRVRALEVGDVAVAPRGRGFAADATPPLSRQPRKGRGDTRDPTETRAATSTSHTNYFQLTTPSGTDSKLPTFQATVGSRLNPAVTPNEPGSNEM